ncbi:hypothetical protein ACFC3O_17415 [Streptomyces sp. NPDC056007]|uniref:hypothetical protein n=1 Tax=Streptomyces sp. NPDC056007 TaxID=3345678 RepID=UPI0035DD7FEA
MILPPLHQVRVTAWHSSPGRRRRTSPVLGGAEKCDVSIPGAFTRRLMAFEVFRG